MKVLQEELREIDDKIKAGKEQENREKDFIEKRITEIEQEKKDLK